MIAKSSSNFSCNSSCHCTVSGAGHKTSTRSATARSRSSLISSPAMIVLPAAGSSASTNRSRAWGSMCRYTAVIWCGKPRTPERLTAKLGSCA